MNNRCKICKKKRGICHKRGFKNHLSVLNSFNKYIESLPNINTNVKKNINYNILDFQFKNNLSFDIDIIMGIPKNKIIQNNYKILKFDQFEKLLKENFNELPYMNIN
jgi:hypothetical protein